MKKTIMTSLFLLFSFGIFAQNQVRISYVSPDSIPSATLDLMDFLDIKYMKMKIHGDIKGKKWQLWVNESHEGKITSKSLFPYAFEFSDTLATFVFIAQDQNDTLTLVCKTPRYSMPKTKYAIDTKNGTAPPTPYILMETLPPTPYTTSDEINLVAYTTGIKRIHQGMDAYDFCGLRYAKTDPKQWQEKFKLPRFVYFSLRLE
ncbi:MAG: hypothetical protein ACLTXP_18225 [Odoribacter splanchnicus]|jgi:hypothetical protein|uniref:Carbohydrate-binding domain-containing protein n=1 Tax=Odoribacter splanchnicus TaxID=28118 RepID=A0A412TWG4_9BACT|nr:MULTISPECIES: hypothetical protein [Odoribacter]MBP7379091.1 hypothetical protein [Odoribacter sp.]MBP8906899.1 hypothetical protein [Odoribacter sp.]MDB9232102.1 hypothetical protein [Odoribacter splanchnicus]MDB9246370.1 hypothetical protein [Odoribacter splanchnicus]OUN96627.1 hypothetical protein B5F99_06840 [Odoribacter splanchnicus]